MSKPKRTENGRYYRIGWWACFEFFSKWIDAAMIVLLSYMAFTNLKWKFCIFSFILILLLFFAFELALLVYVVKVFYNVDVEKSTTEPVNEVFSVGELLNGEGNNDLTTPPMGPSQPWQFDNQVNTP